MNHDVTSSGFLKTISKLMSFNPLLVLPNADYLVSRAQAALGSIDKVKKGHADYLHNMGGEFALALLQLDPADLMTIWGCFVVRLFHCPLL